MAFYPNIALTLPDPSVSIGPAWAATVNAAFSAIDSHDHTGTKGLPIPAAALNVNGDVTWQGNRLTGLYLSRFNSQSVLPSGLTDRNQLIVKSGELYFQDGSGNNVQLTSGGAIGGSVGQILGLAGTTAAVTYSNITKTFVFTQDTNKSANLDVGSINIREPGVVSPKAVTIQSVTSLGSDITLTLPSATGTLATLAGTEVFTNKDIDGGTAANNRRLTLPKDSLTNLGSLTRKQATIFYASDKNKPYVDDGTNVRVIQTAEATQSIVIVDTANGLGSTNTKIRKFSNNPVATGTAITYATSGTAGGSFTINEAGLYFISYSDTFSSADRNFGLSLNSNQLTTNIDTITQADRLTIGGNSAANVAGCCTIIRRFAVNDVIRAHTDGQTDGASTQITKLTIIKIGD